MAPWIGHDGVHTLPSRMPQRFYQPLTDDPGLFDDRPEVQLWSPMPGTLLAVPEHVTPSYAYPLIVWHPDESQDEFSIDSWMQRISTRNYLGLGLRPGVHQRPAAPVRAALQSLSCLLRYVAGVVTFDPRRVYLAGVGTGARTAMEWLLNRPQQFAGVIAIEPRSSAPVAMRMPSAAGLARERVLWIESPGRASEGDESLRVALAAIGPLRVETVLETPDRFGRCIDRWLMQDTPRAVHAH